MTWQERYQSLMMNTFGVPKLLLVRGEGSRVWDDEGNEYLDFLAGIAVSALGHAHPALVSAIQEQAASLVHISNYFASEPQLALAERLQTLTGAGESGRIFFANSGTEANEGAFKLARRHRAGGRVIALEGAFHGRSMGALSLTYKETMRAPFEPLVPGVQHIPVDLDALQAALSTGDVAALFVEAIQGEVGVVNLPDGWLTEARRLTREAGALLIVDEVQTGIARTGDWFAFQHEGVRPDAITLAKGLGGGVPIGAIVAFDEAASLLQPGMHGSTFAGGPLATAAGLAVVTEIERQNLVTRARDLGVTLRERLAQIGGERFTNFGGRGLLVGIGLDGDYAAQLGEAAQRHGVLVNVTGPSRIRLAPPLTISDAEIDEFLVRFSSALEEVAA